MDCYLDSFLLDVSNAATSSSCASTTVTGFYTFPVASTGSYNLIVSCNAGEFLEEVEVYMEAYGDFATALRALSYSINGNSGSGTITTACNTVYQRVATVTTGLLSYSLSAANIPTSYTAPSNTCGGSGNSVRLSFKKFCCGVPSEAPTAVPSQTPTQQPTFVPTQTPTFNPTFNPTQQPTIDAAIDTAIIATKYSTNNATIRTALCNA